MILTAHQPLYMPWLGFFHKAILAETMCILDDVQFADGDYINRNKIKTFQGSKWLTIPVNKRNHLNRQIREIEIIDNGWQKRHLSLIREAYSKTQYFSEYFYRFEELIGQRKYLYLLDLDLAILEFLLRELNIETNLIMSSSLNKAGHKSDLIRSICQELGADVYISGQNGLDYLNLEDFRVIETQVVIQNYEHPVYSQAHGDFIPYMSIIDLLFNSGPKTRDIVLSGNPRVWNKLALA